MHRRSLLLAAAALPLANLPALAAAQETIRIMKSPSCGCCTAWADRLAAAGMETEVREVADDQLWQMKEHLGITGDLASCHTALAGAYVIEGHVPAEDIQRLLAERPDALGLTVPGMPLGSPGMEMGDAREAFDTLLIKADGSTEVFASHS
ncbi:DUF411 domain-containing protein [Leisingera methylohalidivorans]|uniref:Metal-binding protein n=1 Tax=Leisingera methylohalidivorans DSM 14336 TaxID=999552 RepID=V9VRM9_9RHOB|nr:DUF411 domain-containing protein [Leisingera methylohalidivorans]AHC99516.1 hypothetical protein METH_01270 [Leisingera methylohalidivorans DSM 14336]